MGVNICEYVEIEMQSWLAFLCALQLALLSASAFAQDFNDLQKAAEQDDVQAQNILGVQYHDGRAVPQDDAQWFRKAAHQGYAGVQYNLSLMYENGKGAPQAQDFDDLQKAAEQADAQAQNILGAQYHDGRGVPQDDAQAVRWFAKRLIKDMRQPNTTSASLTPTVKAFHGTMR
jgi:TPR repeat protein